VTSSWFSLFNLNCFFHTHSLINKPINPQNKWHNKYLMKSGLLNFFGTTVLSGSGPPRYPGFTITHHSRQDSSGRVISPTQRPLPYNTQNSQETFMSPAGFETHNPKKLSAADPSLRSRGHWDRQAYLWVN